jgi:hypothetical protein
MICRRVFRTKPFVVVALLLLLGLAPSASAQSRDEWNVTFAPLYFWATELNGELTARSTTVPVFLSFADAADNLGGAFSFHLEARKRRWGFMSDLNWVRLSSESEFTTPAINIEGDFDLDLTMFEIGGSYLLSEPAAFSVIGGLRTYTISTKLAFSTPNIQVTPIDTSRTSPNGFVGFTFRPRISDKWTFLSRADIGAGNAELTWSGLLGVEYRMKPWAGLVLGYKALAIDTGISEDDVTLTEYDVTHYGPIFGLNLHWGAR